MNSKRRRNLQLRTLTTWVAAGYVGCMMVAKVSVIYW